MHEIDTKNRKYLLNFFVKIHSFKGNNVTLWDYLEMAKFTMCIKDLDKFNSAFMFLRL